MWRSPLEIFVLAGIQRMGLRTPSSFMEAGLSLGSVLPALRRLEDAELVSSKSSTRGRREYFLTQQGLATLDGESSSCFQKKAADLNSVFNAVIIAEAMRIPYAPGYLSHAIAEWRSRTELAFSAARKRQVDFSRLSLPERRRLMHTLADAHRLEAETKTLEELAEVLEDRGDRQ